MKNISHQIFPDFSSLIGIPYKEKDCWGIAVDFYKLVFDKTLNSYYSEVPSDRKQTSKIVDTYRKDFQSVSIPQFGDLILIRMFGIESHIGVFIGSGKFLHTQEKTGSVVDSLARWEKMIVGYYRVVDD